MGQYGSRALVPVEDVRRDYFPHLDLVNFIRRCDEGRINLPLIRAEKSQKSPQLSYPRPCELHRRSEGSRAEVRRPAFYVWRLCRGCCQR